jgi:hypothetical protein
MKEKKKVCREATTLHLPKWSILVLLAITTVASVGAAQAAVYDWSAEYFNNNYLGGNPVVRRTDQDLNFNWGTGSPDPKVKADQFSVRWTKTQYFSGGEYKIQVTADDGFRVYVDGKAVTNLIQWKSQPPQHTARL